MKVVLSLENGSIPATIGIKKFNPKLNFHGGALKIIQTLTPWPSQHTYRRASVNSFGYGGANAHAILDATESYLGRVLTSFKRVLPLAGVANEHDARGVDGHSNGGNGANDHTSGVNGHTDSVNKGVDGRRHSRAKTYLIPISAHNEHVLQRNIEAISKIAEHCPLADLAYTLGARRSALSERGYALVSGSGHAMAAQFSPTNFKTGTAENGTPQLAFVFTGQGAQWARMGMGLIEGFPSVQHTISSLDEVLATLPEPPQWTILDTLSEAKATSRINDADRSQTVCTAVQIAIVELLRSWGIRCEATVGHSSGEIAAAFAAGYITSRQAIIIAYLRGLTVTRNNSPGAMLAVGVGANEATQYIKDIADIGIACHNSPTSVTLSGTEDAVDAAHGVFSRAGLFSRKLVTSRNAYHSWLMKAAGSDYEQQLVAQLGAESFPVRPDDSPVMFSSVTGEKAAASLPLEYWRENLESPVLFNQAVQALVNRMSDVRYFIEIGPHSALAGPIKDIRAALGKNEGQMRYLSAIKRNSDNHENILNLAGSLFLAGYPVDVAKVNADQVLERTENGEISVRYDTGSYLLDLPRYQWVYEDQYWQESRLSTELRFREHPRHDLLGSLIPGCSKSSPSWRNIVQLDDLPWLRDHKVGEDIVFPAACYISLAITAATQATGVAVEAKPSYTLRGVKISSAMVLREDVGTEVVVDLKALGTTRTGFDFSVSSVVGGKWTSHASGCIHVSKSSPCKLAVLPPKYAV